MKIGITGGTGFVGRYFLSGIGKAHECVVLTTRNCHIPPIGNEVYRFCDYSVESIKKCFEGCDAIVHMAAVRPSVNGGDNMPFFYENISISENIFTAAAELGIKNVVMLSSRSVYNASMKMPLTEDVTEPYSYYGISKLAAENVGSVFNKTRNMNIKFLRLAQVIGVGERKNLMTVYLENSVSKNTLSVYGHGISEKTFIYVKDVVRAILCALNSPDVCGAFNIAMKESVTTKNLAEAFCKVFDNEGNYQLLTDKKEDGEKWIIDVSKAEKLLGFTPAYDIEAALSDMKHDIEEGGVQA